MVIMCGNWCPFSVNWCLFSVIGVHFPSIGSVFSQIGVHFQSNSIINGCHMDIQCMDRYCQNLKKCLNPAPKSNQRKPSMPKNALTLSSTCAGKLFGQSE